MVPQIIPSVIEQIIDDPPADCVSVCNNAAWAVGEIALQYTPDATPLEPFVSALIQRLVPILLNSKSPKSLSENAAVTIGRLGLVCPIRVAPMLGTFAQAWCTALWEIKDNDEKDSAFKGFCMLISKNPAGIEGVSYSLSSADVKLTVNRASSGSAMPFASGNTLLAASTRCSDRYGPLRSLLGLS
jgi:transportin-1